MKRFLLILFTILFLYLATTLVGGRRSCCVAARVIEAMRVIQKGEVLYSITRGRGRFADLRTLGRMGLIEPELASGEVYGYKFQIDSLEESPPKFDLTATPQSLDESCPPKDYFYSNETLMTVYQVDGVTAPHAARENRVPTSGSPAEDVRPRESCLE